MPGVRKPGWHPLVNHDFCQHVRMSLGISIRRQRKGTRSLITMTMITATIQYGSHILVKGGHRTLAVKRFGSRDQTSIDGGLGHRNSTICQNVIQGRFQILPCRLRTRATQSQLIIDPSPVNKPFFRIQHDDFRCSRDTKCFDTGMIHILHKRKGRFKLDRLSRHVTDGFIGSDIDRYHLHIARSVSGIKIDEFGHRFADQWACCRRESKNVGSLWAEVDQRPVQTPNILEPQVRDCLSYRRTLVRSSPQRRDSSKNQQDDRTVHSRILARFQNRRLMADRFVIQ